MRSRIVRIAWGHPNAFGISGLISPDIFARNEACRCERKIVSVAGSCPATLPFIDTSFITGSVVGVSREREIPTPHAKSFFARGADVSPAAGQDVAECGGRDARAPRLRPARREEPASLARPPAG